MPGTQQDRHPNGTIITFDEGPHTYFDDKEQSYRSFTTLIHDYFPQFKADVAAERVAKRERKSVPQLLQEWAASGADACEYGTRVHENCESRMKGLTEPNIARDDRERHTFANAVAVVDWLKSKYQFIAAEKILFSPRCLVAGTVDLMMADGNTLWILDYKTNKEIKTTGFKGERGLFPLAHLDNCNFEHYSIQLSLAEVIAKMEGYIPHDTPCRRALIHFPPMDAPQWIETPDRAAESYEMLIDYVYGYNNNIPF